MDGGQPFQAVRALEGVGGPVQADPLGPVLNTVNVWTGTEVLSVGGRTPEDGGNRPVRQLDQTGQTRQYGQTRWGPRMS